MNIIVIILVTILLSAFFSGMEIAFIASNRLRIEIDRERGAFGSKIVSIFLKKPGYYIVTMLIGNNIALVLYSILIATLLEPAFSSFIQNDSLILLIKTIISTLIILVLAEFFPKALFRISPNFFLRNLSLPTLFFYGLFYPLTVLIMKLTNGLLRLFFGEKAFIEEYNKVFTKVDLDDLINETTQYESDTDMEQQDIRIFQKALDLSNIKLRACMIPRTEIVALPAYSSLEELKHTFIETGHSNILIYEDSIDQVIGYFRLRDLFNPPDDISSLIRKLPIVPESMAANKLLKIFIEENKKLALVVDEFGGTSGLVTIEDIMEEIVGDIEDEHDSVELTERKLSDNEYLFSGRLQIDYINEEYGLSLPDADDYETLAGLVLNHHESIPSVNEVIEIKSYLIRILKVTGTRIELVNVRKK
ncbi:MAG TPA: hemolysin family protein [Bacteroidales bacterium]|nr:hemolysin family protein [Bacteroidales bacterium]